MFRRDGAAKNVARRKLLTKLTTLVVLPLVLLVAIELATTQTERNSGWDSDGGRYGAMLEAFRGNGDLSEVPPHWKWRVVTPFLASLLPLAPQTSFKVLGFLSNWASLVLVYYLVRKLGMKEREAVLGVLLYAGVYWAVKHSAYSPAYIDFQTQTILLLALFLILHRAFWTLPLLLVIAVLQKEALISLAVIAWFAYSRQRGFWRWRSLAYLLALVVPAAVALIAVRWILPSAAVAPVVAPAETSLAVLDPAFWVRFSLAPFSGLGLLTLVLLSAPRTSWRFLRQNPEWLLLVLIGCAMLVGTEVYEIFTRAGLSSESSVSFLRFLFPRYVGNDKARLFLYMLPAIVVVSLHVIRRWSAAQDKKVWFWLAATLCLHYYLGHHFTPMGTFEEYLTWLVPMHAAEVLPQVKRVVAVCALWLVVTISTLPLVQRQTLQ